MLVCRSSWSCTEKTRGGTISGMSWVLLEDFGLIWCMGGDFNVVKLPSERKSCQSSSTSMR